MTSGSRPADDEEIGRLAKEVRATPGGFLSYSMKLLRIRAGFERLREERVVPSIEAGLLAHGLGTLPSTLPPTENPMIWIYLLDGDIGRLVDAARAEGRALT